MMLIKIMYWFEFIFVMILGERIENWFIVFFLVLFVVCLLKV